MKGEGEAAARQRYARCTPTSKGLRKTERRCRVVFVLTSHSDASYIRPTRRDATRPKTTLTKKGQRPKTGKPGPFRAKTGTPDPFGAKKRYT